MAEPVYEGYSWVYTFPQENGLSNGAVYMRGNKPVWINKLGAVAGPPGEDLTNYILKDANGNDVINNRNMRVIMTPTQGSYVIDIPKMVQNGGSKKRLIKRKSVKRKLTKRKSRC